MIGTSIGRPIAQKYSSDKKEDEIENILSNEVIENDDRKLSVELAIPTPSRQVVGRYLN